MDLSSFSEHGLRSQCHLLIYLAQIFLSVVGSYSDLIIEREVLMQKYIHLMQIMETEKVAANQLRTQLEDQDTEIERLKGEVRGHLHHLHSLASPVPPIKTALMFSQIVAVNKAKERMLIYQSNQEEEDPDIKKIKKVFVTRWVTNK